MKVTRFSLTTIAACLLAGCATTGQVMDRTPAVSFTSTAPADQIVSCYAPKALAEWGQSKVIPNGDGQTIVVSGSAWGNPLAIATVMPGQTATSISVKRGNAVSDRVFNSIVATLRTCITP